MRKNIFTVLLLLLISVFCVGQDLQNTNKYKELLSKKLEILPNEDISVSMSKFYQLLNCGFDSIDCENLATFWSVQMVKSIGNNQELNLTYRKIIQDFSIIKDSPEYQALKAHKQNKGHKPEDDYTSIKKYYDYEQALKEQLKTKKPLFIFFTTINDINSDMMKSGVLNQKDILTELKRYTVVELEVMNYEPGKENKYSVLQRSKYKSEYQPLFIIQAINGKWKSLAGRTTEKVFLRFLKSKI